MVKKPTNKKAKGGRKPKPKAKSKDKGWKYVEDINPEASVTMANVDAGTRKGKTSKRITPEDYEEAANLLISHSKHSEAIVKVRCEELAEKFNKRAEKMRETKGSSHQRRRASKWHCKKCNHDFKKPVKKLECSECGSTEIEQLLLTDFQSESAEIEAIAA